MKEEYVIEVNQYISETLKQPVDNVSLIMLYYQIGKYLSEYPISSHDLKRLEWKLQSIYGIVIGFTKRNFVYMIQFYQSYLEEDLEQLKQIPWHQHLVLLKEKDSLKRRKLLYQTSLSLEKTDYMLLELQKLQQKLLCNK